MKANKSKRKWRAINALYGDSQGQQGIRGRYSSQPGDSECHGKIQRRTGESRSNAGGGRAAADFQGQARKVFWRQTRGDRRPIRRDQGIDCRLLAVAGEIDG